MSHLLSIAQKFPDFSVSAVVSLEKGKEFNTINLASTLGKWSVFFFWPMDFTFVCPTEIAEFNQANKKFLDRDAQLYGVSTDSQFVHLAWRQHHPDLINLQFPMLADNKKELSEALGVLHPSEKVPLRATYIVDPTGIIRWVSVNDLSVGRNVNEVLRTLDALQTDELCPCNWEKGLDTIKLS
ncbi:peroxiredoxin [Pigmentibacter ruber]|nr:peroxiredoxin [Pigmentibacter ruber]